jgi:hypothetical protein
MWLTKVEIVERIAARGFGEFIRDTRSCTRVRDMTILNSHCGKCSQCVDRRFAMIAAGQAHNDPEEAYKVDLFLDERPAGPDWEMALAYVRSASDVNQMEDVAFFSRYGEVSRAVRFFAEPAGTVAERVFDLHQLMRQGFVRSSTRPSRPMRQSCEKGSFRHLASSPSSSDSGPRTLTLHIPNVLARRSRRLRPVPRSGWQ